MSRQYADLGPSTQRHRFVISPFGSRSTSTRKTASVIDDSTAVESKGPLGLNLLHSPSEPLIDFVFVHGLGGGSRKSWSKTSSPAHYWPQKWLPKDPAFKNVRVHSFGYNSDLIKAKDDCLDINHFGKSLLGELITSPYLAGAETPIVFIGHSMGGLVIKKAYLVASQDAIYDSMVKRFHTICFLATPHRGSDWARLLNNMLQVAYSSRTYVASLKRGSGALQSINDQFDKHSANMDIWSFYETQKLSLGVFNILIVDPSSATLGQCETETQIPLTADHRSICKFDTEADPNYVTIRNALESAVNSATKLVLESKEKLRHSQIKDLERYLGVSTTIEDDLVTVEDARLPGTCEWISKKPFYLKWKDFGSDTTSILWLNGKPAAGKSVLAGYVIGQLRKTNENCSFYFFKYGDESRSGISGCLRSLAFQMACTSAEVREALLEMQENDVRLKFDDERIIWRKLFLSGIFQTGFSSHYWVIDALDECSNLVTFFSTMLSKLDESVPLRILITSRETPEVARLFSSLGAHRVRRENIPTTDTLPDIKALIEAKAKSLAVKDDYYRASLVGKILEKSQGSFLWTILVLAELSNSHGEEDINRILEEVPRDMEPLYQRSLEQMSQHTHGKKLTKAVLTWTTCATRPMKLKEFEGALKLDVKDNFPRLRDSILALCGQLVTVDKFDKVQLVHETVREFLLKDDLESEFAINKKETHTRIARACFLYLTGDEMKPPRTRRHVSAGTGPRDRAEFSAYACAVYSYHLTKADPLAHDLVALVEKFLKLNVLSWIEVIAQRKDLRPLIRTARNLKIYLDSCIEQRSPFGSEMRTIEGWTTDLIRIATKFADALIASPAAIYSLILPFCPKESMVYQTKSPVRRPSVIGPSNVHWDDRLSCMEYDPGETSAVCYGEKLLAVGLTTGKVALYDATSCQKYKFLDHGEAVQFLLFQSQLDLIVSCGIKMIRVWNAFSGQLIHRFQAPRLPIGLAFDENLLIVASDQNYLASWDLGNGGVRRPNRPWNDIPWRGGPCAVSISVSHQMLAVAPAMGPIALWDLQGDTYYGSCGKKLPGGETSTHPVSALVFNPNPEIGLLAATYLNGELVLIDPFQDQVLVNFRAHCHTLAANPDGRLLAGGAGFGTVHIYEFETLSLLYRVRSSEIFITQLAFSGYGLHLADIRGEQCNIWTPTVLLRDSTCGDSSEDTSSSFIEAVATDTEVKISAMVVHPKGEVAFCSKDDGSVCIYDLKSGAQLQTVCHHDMVVYILAWWCRCDAILSVDASNSIFLWNIQKTPQKGWVAEKLLFEAHLDCEAPVIEVLLSETVGKFILSTSESDHLWSIGGQEESARKCRDGSGIRKWVQHQLSPHHLICFDGVTAHTYTWSDWSRVSSVCLNIDVTDLEIKSAITYTSGNQQGILLELSELDGPMNTRNLHVIEAASFDIETKPSEKSGPEATNVDAGADAVEETTTAKAVTPPLTQKLATLSDKVNHVIGFSDTGRMVFLDTNSWVCSVDLNGPDHSRVSYIRHFFVPYEWFAGEMDIISALFRRDVLFAKNDDIAIVRPGLDYAEEVTAEPIVGKNA